jgi:hypothetical protein
MSAVNVRVCFLVGFLVGPAGVHASSPGVAMNEPVLVVSGWDAGELDTILRTFRGMYQERFAPSFKAEIAAGKQGQLRVTFPAGIDAVVLGWLVNYVHYPKGFDLRRRHIVAMARVTLTREFDLPDTSLLGQKAIIYVPKEDREYDLVYVRTDAGSTFENSFAESKWKRVHDARLPNGIDDLR